MLINKAKRAEQNLKICLFFLYRQNRLSFCLVRFEFKAQIIELIRQAKNAFT